MTHPFYTHIVRQHIPLQAGQKPAQPRPIIDHRIHHHRGKRCCASGAVGSNGDFNVPELNAGNGHSLGAGSIAFFKEDVSGGPYTLVLQNIGRGMAEVVVYATKEPSESPFPNVEINAPQVEVSRAMLVSLIN